MSWARRRRASLWRIGRRLATPVGVWDTDGFRREFVAKVIVVASEPPACRDADCVWAAKDELDHAIEATVVRYAPTVLTR